MFHLSQYEYTMENMEMPGTIHTCQISVERKFKTLDKKQPWLYIYQALQAFHTIIDHLLEQQLQRRNLPAQCSCGSWRSLLLNAQLQDCFSFNSRYLFPLCCALFCSYASFNIALWLIDVLLFIKFVLPSSL